MASLFCRSVLRRGLHTAASQFTQKAAVAKAPPTTTTIATTSAPSLLPTVSYGSPSAAQSLDFFNLKKLYTLEDLMEARVHFGHKDSMLNEHMRPYIFGKRLGVLIFDLEQTDKLLQLALNVTAEIAYRNGIILFVHQSRQNGHIVEAAAKECGEYAYCRKWSSSVFTDSQRTFGAVTRLPDLVVILSLLEKANELHPAVTISARMLIPTVGICDTNTDPTLVTYPVPGNDDSPQSIEFYCRLFKTAILNGKAKRKEIIERQGEDYYYKTLEVED